MIMQPPPTCPKIVAFRACDDYDKEKVYQTVEKLLADAPPPDVHNKVVLLKPNILSPKGPECAVCTHYAVVYAVIKAFFRRGAAKNFGR
jgi:uncharacterized protein (DUF362 family)